MLKHPLGEVFGFPADNLSSDAERYRRYRLCPFNNKVPNCTKDKADNPLGVCSILYGQQIAITCPVRFRQEWLIAEDAAGFFFPGRTAWTSLTEVRLNDRNGKSAGNIDVVLVAYDSKGNITDFGALEVQAVYISGNIRRPFEHYMEDPESRTQMDWSKQTNYPRPDYLSSSRKRLAPQLLYKGGILHTWGKKIAVALDSGFFETLPTLEETDPHDAEVAWFIYDLKLNDSENRYTLSRERTVYTTFSQTLMQITTPDVGDLNTFLQHLQTKLDKKLENGHPPDNSTIDLSL